MSLNNIVVMNRGDTYTFDLTINDENSNDGVYHLQGDDVVYFGLMLPHQPFEVAIVRKRYTIDDLNEFGTITISLEPSDTLDLDPGVYYYAVKLHMDHQEVYADGTPFSVDEVVTVINKTKFVICD